MFNNLHKQRDIRYGHTKEEENITEADARTAVQRFLKQRPRNVLVDSHSESDHVQPVRYNDAPALPRVSLRNVSLQSMDNAQMQEEEANVAEDDIKQEDAANDLQQQQQRRVAELLGIAEDAAKQRLQRLNAAYFDVKRKQEAERLGEELRKEAERIQDEKRRKEALELLRKLEEERRIAHEAWLLSERKRQQQQQEKEAQEKEIKRQRQLQQIGKCCQGYPWINRGGGSYQCAGGSHWHTFCD